MLINGTRDEQLRVAIVDGTILQEYQVEIAEDGLTRGNIYRGVVANVQPSLNAAFIDIGEERHGFLPVADVLPSAYHKKPPADVRRPRIDQVIEKGKPILVQVTKDGIGQKGPALNTNLAIAGRYLVHTPFDSVRGISRKVVDDDARKKVRDRLKKLSMPDTHGVIVRTNGLDQNQTTLNRDLAALLRLWKKISTEAARGKGPRLIYSDQDLVVQGLRDYLDPGIAEVIVDSDDVFQRAESYMKAFMPRSKTKLVRYNDRLPLFSRYRLETQIDRIYERSAPLPSGGMIVIDQTEALTAIDVNSARATRNDNHDESIFRINCEAAEEVARQLRLRDIGGLVVVDFIDMRLRKHQNKLEKVLRDSMKPDKARWSVGQISPNGLLEINRQRIKQALRLRTHRPCPTCSGLGSTPTPEFAALRLLSRIEARAATGLMHSVTLALHPEIADSLQNHYRKLLASIEDDHGIHIEIVSAPNLGRTEERVDWVQKDGSTTEGATAKSVAAVGAADLSVPERRKRRAASSKTERNDKGRTDKSRSDRGRGDRVKADQSADSRRASSGGDDSDENPARSRRRSRRKPSDEPQEVARAEETTRSRSSEEGGADEESKPRRRRSRRRSSRKGADAQASEGNIETQSESASTEAAADSGQDDQDTRTRQRSRRRRSRRRSGSDEAQAPSSAAQAQEGSPSDEDQDSDSDGKSSRRRRSRRRRSGSGRPSGGRTGGGPPNRGKKVVDDSIGNRISGKDRSAGGGRPSGNADGNRAKKARPKKDPNQRRGGRRNKPNTDYDERQPDSNESALHRGAAPTKVDPLPPPVDLSATNAPDRPVSQRLRWQWWGGGGKSGRGGRPLPSDDE